MNSNMGLVGSAPVCTGARPREIELIRQQSLSGLIVRQANSPDYARRLAVNPTPEMEASRCRLDAELEAREREIHSRMDHHHVHLVDRLVVGALGVAVVWLYLRR